MSLATKCPHCGTIFKVAKDQLKLQAGLVRCGVCQLIFNGIDQLIDVDDQAHFTPSPPPPSPPEQNSEANHTELQLVEVPSHPEPLNQEQPALSVPPIDEIEEVGGEADKKLADDLADESSMPVASATSRMQLQLKEELPAQEPITEPNIDGTEEISLLKTEPYDNFEAEFSDVVSEPAVAPPENENSSLELLPPEESPIEELPTQASSTLPDTSSDEVEEIILLKSNSYDELDTEFSDLVADEPARTSTDSEASRIELQLNEQPSASDIEEIKKNDEELDKNSSGHVVSPPSTLSNSQPPSAQTLATPATVDEPVEEIIILKSSLDDDFDKEFADDASSKNATSRKTIKAAKPDSDQADLSAQEDVNAQEKVTQHVDSQADKGGRGGKDDAKGLEQLSFIRQANKKKRTTRLFFLGIGILSFLLAGQTTYLFRNYIAATVPSTQKTLTALCEVFHCQIQHLAQLDALSYETAELHTLPRANTYEFGLLMRNQSALTQAWPHIELTLQNERKQTVLRRVFTPAEYLPKPSDVASGFPARSEYDLHLYFEMDHIQASDYAAEIFYS